MPHGGEHDTVDVTVSGLAPAALALARRFAAGGTLWCWSPGAPEHAQHVAVEFVHPVIVGTRALPAVAVTDLWEADAIATLRPLARSGDALLIVASADAAVGALVARASAWGLTTLWLGAGAPPLDGRVDHLLWQSEDPLARHDGRLVLGYHLLWELTQVCFEHPGLLAAPAEEAVCVTCSDEGRLGEVVSVDVDVATVRTATGLETVSTLMVGTTEPGDLVLVHAGTAITVVRP
jgi:hypothetical protein